MNRLQLVAIAVPLLVAGCDTSTKHFPVKPPKNATAQERRATEAANKSFQAVFEGMGEGVQKMGETIEHQLTPADEATDAPRLMPAKTPREERPESDPTRTPETRT